MKRIVTILLCVILVVALAIPAFAEETNDYEVNGSPIDRNITGHIKGENVNLRTYPGFPNGKQKDFSNVALLLQDGKPFHYLGDGGYANGIHWIYIEVNVGTPNRTAGYVSQEFLVYDGSM